MITFKIGLGWDTKCDIDASVLLFEQTTLKENISFSNLRSSTDAVVHSGDNLTGEGDGDDEVISVELLKIPQEVDSIWPVINIYEFKTKFNDVKGAYCRIYNGNNELVRFDLSANMDGTSKGNIVANFKRNGNHWTFKALGYYTEDTTMSSDMVPIIYKVMNNDFSSVKILA